MNFQNKKISLLNEVLGEMERLSYFSVEDQYCFTEVVKNKIIQIENEKYNPMRKFIQENILKIVAGLICFITLLHIVSFFTGMKL